MRNCPEEIANVLLISGSQDKLSWRNFILAKTLSNYLFTVKSCYNAVQFFMILRLALRWPWQNVDQILKLTTDTSPSRASYGLSVERIWEKIEENWPHYNGTALYCMWGCWNIFTRGLFWPSGIVVACVCVSVSLCVNHLLVRAITQDPFKLGSPNLKHRCKRPWLRSLLFWGVIDLYLQRQNLPHFELVRAITHHLFKLGPPNLDQRCKIPWLRSLLFWGLIEFDMSN